MEVCIHTQEKYFVYDPTRKEYKRAKNMYAKKHTNSPCPPKKGKTQKAYWKKCIEQAIDD